ncbi:MAG: zinc metalloprotease [Planctomycetota bacterium]|jgi:predicted Zn-dependent protease
MRAAMAAAVLAAGLAGCGPDAAPAPTRAYVTYVVETQDIADVIRPYLPSVEATFGVRTRVEVGSVTGWENLPRARHEGTPQADADTLLDRLPKLLKSDDAAVVGLTWATVYGGSGESKERLYGRGREESRVAVVGLGALRHTGLKRAAERVASRRLRVLLHETGHALGRAHCDDPWCLMAECNGPEELDRTALVPCDVCLASYAAVHASLKPATLRQQAAAAAKAHGWTIDPPTKKAVAAAGAGEEQSE